jgi:hypothetical protein
MIHITNGGCAMAVIQQAGIDGDVAVWADVLYEGPVPGGLEERELREIRANFLSDGEPNAFSRILSGLEQTAAIVDRRSPDEDLLLWFEHDLFDQLALIHLLDRLAASPAGASRASLICINAFPGRPSFKGLGELTPGELATLLDVREPITNRHFDIARRAWEAFRSSDPRAIEEVVAHDLRPLSFLGAALRRYLEEFPSTVNGLSRSEMHLLEIIETQPFETWEVFPRMHEGETAYYITDSSLWDLALGLAPLVSIEGDIRTSSLLPQAAIAITTSGRDALEGRLDRVRVYGIDRWLGGVHLEGRGPMWRWNPAIERLARS